MFSRATIKDQSSISLDPPDNRNKNLYLYTVREQLLSLL